MTSTTTPRRSMLRTTAALLGALAAAAVSVGFLATGGTQPAPMMPSPLLDAEVRGVYRLDSGAELTLLGSERRPSYELDGTLVELTPTGDDGFVATDDPHESMTVQRTRDGAVGGLVLRRGDDPPVDARRRDAFSEHDVRFASAGAELAGTILVPSGEGPHPAVVIVHGAERGNRETYRLLATHYARRGVAALIYDKRGLGESTGDVASATFEDLTDDALAGVDVLRAMPDVDTGRVGVAGFSQGAWVAALAADRADDVAFVVTYSASGYSPADQNAWLYGNMLAIRGLDAHTIGIADRVMRMLYSTVDLVDAGVMPSIPHVPGFWFHALDLHLDTAGLWEQVDQPVLGVWGANDCQVPAIDSAHVLADALRRGGNRHHTLVVIDGADHGLTVAGPCEHELGIHHHGRVQYAPEYLDAGADWVHRFDEPAASRGLILPDETGPTVLGWHQAAPAPAPWYGTAALQVPTLVLLPLAFLVLGAVVLVGSRRHGRRPFDDSRGERTTIALIAAGLVATATGAIALGELAGLGDLQSAFLVGGPIGGAPTLLLVAGIAANVATILTVVFTVRLARRRRPAGGAIAPRHWATAALGIVSIAWAVSWQLLLTPWIVLVGAR